MLHAVETKKSALLATLDHKKAFVLDTVGGTQQKVLGILDAKQALLLGAVEDKQHALLAALDGQHLDAVLNVSGTLVADLGVDKLNLEKTLSLEGNLGLHAVQNLGALSGHEVLQPVTAVLQLDPAGVLSGGHLPINIHNVLAAVPLPVNHIQGLVPAEALPTGVVTDTVATVTDAVAPVTNLAAPVTNALAPVTSAAAPVTNLVQPVVDTVGGTTGLSQQLNGVLPVLGAL